MVVFKNEKIFEGFQNENAMICEDLIQEINASTVQDKEKISDHSEIYYREKNGTNSESRMPNELSEKSFVENKPKEISSSLSNTENLENHLNMNLLSNIID